MGKQKDPAVLWYWADWHSGTVTFTRFLKGAYMDVLHAQFNSGPLSLEEIKTVLGSDFGSSWPTLQKKFKKTDEGLFFNERADAEKKKREEFSKKQKDRADKRWQKDEDGCRGISRGNAKTLGNAFLEDGNENKYSSSIYKYKAEDLKNSSALDLIGITLKIKIESVNEMLDSFIADRVIDQQKYRTMPGLIRHFREHCEEITGGKKGKKGFDATNTNQMHY